MRAASQGLLDLLFFTFGEFSVPSSQFSEKPNDWPVFTENWELRTENFLMA
jgi:hypothetical protein